MASIVRRLGAAVLLGTIPFAATGCKNGNTDTVQAEEVKPHVRNISEVFQYKRDNTNYKVFISSNKDPKKLQDELSSLGIYGGTIRRLFTWQQAFNDRAFYLGQQEIRFDLLDPPSEAIEKNLMPSTEHLEVFPFIDPFKDKELKSSSFLLTPYASYLNEDKVPLAITLNDKFKFLPYSVERRHYLHKHSDGLLQVKEGIYFKVQEITNDSTEENKGVGISVPLEALPITVGINFKLTERKGRVLDVIVPLENSPISIATDKVMYLIGLDRVSVGEGKFGVVEQ